MPEQDLSILSQFYLIGQVFGMSVAVRYLANLSDEVRVQLTLHQHRSTQWYFPRAHVQARSRLCRPADWKDPTSVARWIVAGKMLIGSIVLRVRCAQGLQCMMPADEAWRTAPGKGYSSKCLEGESSEVGSESLWERRLLLPSSPERGLFA
jgi:hypothetical protein